MRFLSTAAALLLLPAYWAAVGDPGERTLESVPVVLASWAVWAAVETASGHLSAALVPETYGKLDVARKSSWNSRIPATLHAALVCAVVPVLLLGGAGDEMAATAADGAGSLGTYHPHAALLLAVSTGYFCWDLKYALDHPEGGAAFAVHGVLCLWVYGNSLRPFCQDMSLVFLGFELSSPFVHAYWFLERFPAYAGGGLQRACGIATTVIFFVVRILWGFHKSALFHARAYAALSACWSPGAAGGSCPPGLVPTTLSFQAINVVLNVLNLVWFYGGVRSALCPRKRRRASAKSE